MFSIFSKPISISTKRALSFEHMSQTYSAMVSLMSTVRTGTSRDKLLAMNSTPNLYVNMSRPLSKLSFQTASFRIPFLSSAAANKTVLDLQDILQRFAFDNICKIAFGYDPAYLLPSLPQEQFAVAFDTAARIIREFAKEIVKEKKQELGEKSSLESVDLLSRFLSSGHSVENFVSDIIISFILAGRDTTSAALTWFFWLISRHPDVENEILK
ncbi:Cytochrome P450 94A1 [Camellia lanceoleosa]|uniref:Cytochrome P450 94A1 n=1 Tax=Camellia lanceoleosa TaxID=1840588 RepID=A0ACC0FV11_9ERIC|nr:Cytochrome P450 94A1 [Camellia lanceoleosa]